MSAHISGGYAKEPPTYGKVLLNTSIGDIDIELWPKQAPKACRNFIQLIMEQYYNDCIFHRVIPNFMAQTGDPTGTGHGGESAYGIPFKDEFHSRLKFSHRGIIAMANSGSKNDNKSQFFITLDKCDWLNRKHTIFGKVTGNTIYNILKFNDLEINKENDTPMIEQKINSIEILLNPFDDIIARPSKTEKSNQAAVDKENDKLNKKNKLKAMGAKNDMKLLAFGDDEEDEEEQLSLIETNNRLEKLKSERKVDKESNDENKVVDEHGNENDNKMMDIIRKKLSEKSKRKKRNFSEMDNENDSDLAVKKRKMDGNNDEYERIKKQLLDKRENDNEVDYDDEEEVENGHERRSKLEEQREEYIKKTRMNKRDRNKFTMNKLNDFMSVIDGVEKDDDMGNTKKGKVDENTGIQFDRESDEDDGYDPNWFKSKLEFRKRPQDVEIYSVDDYTTIYGNSKQNIDENKNKYEKRRDRKHKNEGKDKKNDGGHGRKDYNRDRNRTYYSDRKRR